MKTKLILLLMAATLSLSACGNKASEPSVQQSTDQSTEQSSAAETTSSSSGKESSSDESDLAILGSVEVEQGLTDIQLTIPKEFVGTEQTQDDLNNLCEEYGFKSATLNDDGSATYIMTKEKHREYMDQIKEELGRNVFNIIGSESFPNITDIIVNEDFTEFTITTKSTELDLAESYSIMAFYTIGGLYNSFNGTPTDDITVTFLNADSREVISTSNSGNKETE